MAARTVFLTGFPGFLSRHLLDRMARRHPDDEYVFLIQEHLRAKAEAAVTEQERRTAGFAERVHLVAGDITAGPELGMDEAGLELAKKADVVWHLAAVYNLAIDLPTAYTVNVLGTANVLDFCLSLDRVERFNYVSTCYVAGDRTGRVYESELDVGQGFKNHYESTKCWAELDVRRKMDRLPTSIYRPSIVVGDSKTGETDKYDGPYYLIRALLRLPRWVPIPLIGPGRAAVNFAPVDFVTEAMAVLSDDERAVGLTFHLADPNPHPTRETLVELARLTGHRFLPVTVPEKPVEKIAALRFVEEFLQMPKETLPYMNHEVVFDTANTDRLLSGTGVTCPDLFSYLPVLVDYVRRHPEKQFLDGRAF